MTLPSAQSADAAARAPLLRLVAGLCAATIFVLDTLTPWDIAIAVLYVAVVLLAVNITSRRGLLLVSAGCIALTLLSFAISHGPMDLAGPVARCAVSIASIAIATFLALRIQATTQDLRARTELLDLTHDTIFVRRMDDVITYWNHGAEELYGWTAAEAVGRVTHELLRTGFPRDRQMIMVDLLRTGRWEGELVHRTRGGAMVTVSSRWSLKRDGSGLPVAILETNTDITERKRAEERSRQHEKDLELIIDTIPAFTWSTRPDGSVHFISVQWERAGYAVETLRHDPLAVVHPDDTAQVRRRWAIAQRDMVRYEVEARVRSLGGAYRWFLHRAVPLRDAAGGIVEWYGSSTDIEEQKSAQEALLRSEAFLAEAQRLSRTGSFSLTVPGHRVLWSDETYRLFGYDRSVTPTIALIRAHIHPEDMAIFEGFLASAARSERNIEARHRLLLPDGTVKHVQVIAHATDTAPATLEYLGALMDVTASVEAEEALHRSQAELAHVTRMMTLGELTASIAHEVNQPLSGIVTNGEACLRWLGREVPDVGEARSAVERMIADGRRASEVVRRLRALTRKDTLPHEALAIDDVIEDAVQLIRRELLIHRTTLATTLGPDLPRVSGDRVQLQQLVINLVMNGIQAVAGAPAAARKITIGAQKSGDGLLVSVHDSGPGIAPDAAAHLFNAFFTTKPNGMGMGLSICRSIVEVHGGRIWAENDPAGGAVFRFMLPAVTPTLSADMNADAP